VDFEPALIESCSLTPAGDLFGNGECDLSNLKDQIRDARRIATKSRIKARRAKSESNLSELLPLFIETGDSWHVISQGNIDSMSYLAHIIEYEPLDYLLMSTWCMAGEDVARIGQWIDEGKISRVDCYVGEIFPNQYTDVHAMLCQTVRRVNGRVCVFRNHAKIFAGINSRFAFAIESSANINTNPRCEQTAIHGSRELFDFYKDFFDGINGFTRDFDNWTPYEIRPATETDSA
jgi:hypothetical protein